ncbi:MAG: nickel-responsive regulator 1 [archaeon]|jgi:CopG family nickel-responsive transcriptional regulator
MAKILSFSLNDASYAELEVLYKNLGFSGKSETIRAALRALSKENESISKLKGNMSAILVITHQHDEGITSRVHKYDSVVVTHIHQHVRDKCVEIFMLKGSAKTIQELFKSVSKAKSIFDIKLVPI